MIAQIGDEATPRFVSAIQLMNRCSPLTPTYDLDAMRMKMPPRAG